LRAAWQGGSNFEAPALQAPYPVRLLWIGLACGLWPGCRCASDTPPGAVDKPAVVSSNCARGGVPLTLAPSVLPGAAGSPGVSQSAGSGTGTAPSPDAAPDPDPGIDLPFSIEPGMALGLGGRFFATALRHDPQGSMALLARLPPAANAAAVPPAAVSGGAVPAAAVPAVAPEAFELGRIEGDVPPPRLAVDGNDLLVALEVPVPGRLSDPHRALVARRSRGAAAPAARVA
jgi:hypothetical protein